MEEFYLKYESKYGKLTKQEMKEMVNKWIVNLKTEIDTFLIIKSTEYFYE